MSRWDDGLRPARFRGIEFLVSAHEGRYGRRLVVHEFPGRARPSVEDFGRDPRVYRIEAFLLGDDSHLRRDQLIAAAERNPTEWPTRVGSRLEHPYLGELDVCLRSARVRQDARAGRLVQVSLEFVEAGTEPAGITQRPTVRGAQADQAAVALEEATAEAQVEKLSGPGSPQVVQDAALSELQKALSALTSIDVLSGPSGAIQAFEDGVGQLAAKASQLVTAPAELVSLALGTVAAIEDAVGNAIDSLAAYDLLLDQVPATQAGGVGLSQVAESVSEAVTDTFKLAAVGRSVGAAARADWPTIDDALEQQERLLGSIIELQARVDDDVYQALQAVRARLMVDVPPDGISLPRLDYTTPGQSVSTILLAYQVDGDLGQELAIARRSKAEHPGFLPAGKPVAVVVDG